MLRAPMASGLRFEHVGKKYGATRVLSDVDFLAEPGELVVLVGPSGCGKSTLMRLVAGLETIDEGRICFDDKVLNDVPPHERGVGMVFQSYALYPHMTVRENLAFPLRVKKVDGRVVDHEVERVANLLALSPLLHRLPKELSGGQRQRVAIGRCLVRKPEIYCFDEPLSNLDAALRSQIRVELKALQRELGKTALYVTHDQTEAMTMADRIVVLHKGVVQQVGAPRELYQRPANQFVGRFIGSPAMTCVRGRVDGRSFVSGDLLAQLPELPSTLSGETEVVLGLRPEHLTLCDEEEPGAISATVRAIEPVGENGYLHLEVKGAVLSDSTHFCASVGGTRAFELREGAAVSVRCASEGLSVFHGETGRRLA
jgi:ABC-type sugar transport system ATPase subunit